MKALSLTSKDLEKQYGRCITDMDLARYFQVDVRTLRKYAQELGGVMILPGKYRFFENLLRERIEYAQFDNQKWDAVLSGKRSDSRYEGSKKTENLPGYQQKVLQGGCEVGRKKEKGGDGRTSPHGIY